MCPTKQTKFIKIFRLYQTLKYSFLCFSQSELAHFGLGAFFPKKWDKKIDKIQKDFWTLSNLYVLNFFKYFLIYILGHFVSNNQTRKMLNYIKSSYIISCTKMTVILCIIFSNFLVFYQIFLSLQLKRWAIITH